MLLVYIAAGGAIGAALRHLLSVASLALLGPAFPVGTLLCNVAGSLAIGWLALTLEHESAKAFWMIGVLGGFTTFSSFSLQTLELVEQGAWGTALAYVAVSLTFCLGGVALGVALARG